MTLSEWISLFNAAGVFLAGSAAFWSVAVGKRGVEVSKRNENALDVVQVKQALNKDEIKTAIEDVHHEITNGLKVAYAKETVKHLTPVLEETGKVIADQVAQTNASVAAALAEQKASWDGVERRVGPVDRRAP